MPGVTAIGTAAMSISMSIATPTSIETLIAIRPNSNCSNAGKLIKGGRERGSIIRSTAKGFPIEIRERPRSLTGRAPMMRSNRASNSAVEPIKADRISRVGVSVTAVELVIGAEWVVVEWAIAAALAIAEESVIEGASAAEPAVVNSVAEIASAQRTVGVAEATSVAARGAAAVRSKAPVAAVARHARPAHAAAQAGVAVAGREVVVAGVVAEGAVAGADNKVHDEA